MGSNSVEVPNLFFSLSVNLQLLELQLLLPRPYLPLKFTIRLLADYSRTYTPCTGCFSFPLCCCVVMGEAVSFIRSCDASVFTYLLFFFFLSLGIHTKMIGLRLQRLHFHYRFRKLLSKLILDHFSQLAKKVCDLLASKMHWVFTRKLRIVDKMPSKIIVR